MRKFILATTALGLTLATIPALAQDGSGLLQLPIVDKPLELTIHMHHKRYTSYNEDWPVEQAARQMTNIYLKNATVGSNSDNSDEALNLLLASGKMPDIVGMAGIKPQVDKYGPEGAFQPLNDLIDKDAPDIKAFLDSHPDIKSAITSSDGNIYYIPYLPDGKYGRGYFIRYDWLKKLGLDVPQNVDQLHDVLLAFRNDDPNGNGLKDEIPYFATQFNELIRLVTLWDGRSSGSDTQFDFYVKDGEIHHGFVEEGYHVGMSNLAEWYKEGLIDPEIFTRGNNSREALLGQNLGGMTHDWFASTASYNDTLKDKIPGFDWEAMAPPASVSGVRMEEHRRIPVKPDGWAIGYTNKHPEETMKYFDFWFTPEGKDLANFGVEGQQWTMVDGHPQFTTEMLTNGQPVNNQLYAVGSQLQARGYPQDYAYEEQWTNQTALDGIALYDEGDYLIDQFLGVSLNPDEQAVYDKYWPGIRTYMLEKQQAWILGSADINADWDNYLSEVDRMGYSKVIGAMQEAYDRQYKAN
ncbi:extracellular solute-binding protein [Martelella sp. HB161492]|uniref:extracellular solute-binding protein n=1 Tax=Martelella sp. HB161492 TaxID=2720726 RepID=UPI0015901D15|nr:extracellular solute-binding protein [Martelella sp. HB161492]